MSLRRDFNHCNSRKNNDDNNKNNRQQGQSDSEISNYRFNIDNNSKKYNNGSYHNNYSTYWRSAENDFDWRRPDSEKNEDKSRRSNNDGNAEIKEIRVSFMIGLLNTEEVQCAVSQRCRDLMHAEIVSYPDTNLSKSFSNVDGLEEELRRQLRCLKRKKSPSFVTLHHGLMHYFRPEGTHRVGHLLRHAKYERLFHDSVNFSFIDKLPSVQELTRFDVQISTPDPDCSLTYQVFVKDGGFVRDISEIDKHLSKFLVPLSIPPGFLIKKSKTVCRFDIINPKNNITTRLKLNYIDSNDSLLALTKKHGRVLEDFFKRIKMKTGTEEMELNILDLDIPDGYIIEYYRRSYRKEYIFHDNQLQVSTERVYQNTESSYHPERRFERDITDVFIWNSSLSEVFKYPDWSEDTALTIIESELKFQDDVMLLLE